MPRKISTPLLVFPPMQIFNTYRILQHLYPKGREPFCVLGDVYSPGLTAKAAKAAKVDAIYTSPAALQSLIPDLEEIYDLANIKLIHLRGDYCSEEKANFFKSKFPNAFIEFTLGSIETGRSGYRCKFLYNKPPRFYHPLPSHYFEVDNSQQDSRLVITALTSEILFPVIRYLTDDVGTVKNVKCRCGNNTTIEMLGRIGGEVAKFSGVTLYAFLVEKALSAFSQIVSPDEFQVHIYERKIGSKLLTELEIWLLPQANTKMEIPDQLALKISDKLYLGPKTTLTDLVNRQSFLPLKVKFVKGFEGAYKQKRLVSHIL